MICVIKVTVSFPSIRSEFECSSTFKSEQVFTFDRHESIWWKGCLTDCCASLGASFVHRHRVIYTKSQRRIIVASHKIHPSYALIIQNTTLFRRFYRCNSNLIRSMPEKQHASQNFDPGFNFWTNKKMQLFQKRHCVRASPVPTVTSLPNIWPTRNVSISCNRNIAAVAIQFQAERDANDLTHFFSLSHFIVHLCVIRRY